MQYFNQWVPWGLTCLAIFAVASGMNASPGMMAVSGMPDSYEEWCKDVVREAPATVDCAGDSEKDGVYRLAGFSRIKSDPLLIYHNSLKYGQADYD